MSVFFSSRQWQLCRLLLMIVMLFTFNQALSKKLSGDDIRQLLTNNTLCERFEGTDSTRVPLESYLSKNDINIVHNSDGSISKYISREHQIYASMSVSVCVPFLPTTRWYHSVTRTIDVEATSYVLAINIDSYGSPRKRITIHVPYFNVRNTYGDSPASFLIAPTILDRFIMGDGDFSESLKTFVETNAQKMEKMNNHIGLTGSEALWVRAGYYSKVVHTCFPLLYTEDEEELSACQDEAFDDIFNGAVDSEGKIKRGKLFENTATQIRSYNFGLWAERSIHVLHAMKDMSSRVAWLIASSMNLVNRY